MTAATRRTREVEHEYSYGVLLLVNADTARVNQSLESIRVFSLSPARVVIVDRSAKSALETECSVDLPFPVNHWCTGDDMGVAGSLEIGLRYLSECDSVLLIDDNVILGSHAVESMLGDLRDQMGAVVGVSSAQKESAIMAGPESHQFRWFPSMLRSDVIERVGTPLMELFSGYDDLEYGLRISEVGYSVVHRPVELFTQAVTRQQTSAYLLARNLTYLLLHKRRWSAHFLRDWLSFCLMATRPTHAAIRRGLLDGLRRRLGPPPSELNWNEGDH